MPTKSFDPMEEHDKANVGVLNRRDDEPLSDDEPTRAELMERLALLEAQLAAPTVSDDEIPSGLIVATPSTPLIDPNNPEDQPDLPDGEWSKGHFLRFLARQPKSMVFLRREPWEPKSGDVYQYVGLQGHSFRVLKDKPVMVPVQIAAIIEQSQEEFPTTQSQAKKRALTNIMDMPAEPGSLGVPGVETFLVR